MPSVEVKEKGGDEGESKKAKSEGKLMPPFTDMVNYIHQKSSDRVKTNQKYVIGNNVLAFNPTAYIEVRKNKPLAQNKLFD